MLEQTRDRLGEAEAGRGALEAELRELRDELRRRRRGGASAASDPASEMMRQWRADHAHVEASETEHDDAERPFWVVGFWWTLNLVTALAGGTTSFDRKKLPGTAATLAVMAAIAAVIGVIALAVWWQTRG